MKLLGFLFRLLIVVGLAVWLADRPGSAQIVWRDMVIETSAAFLLLAVALFAYACTLLWRLWRFIVEGPRVWRLKRQVGKIEEAQADLAKGLAAIAAGEAGEAGRYAVKARKVLGETPMTQFVLAQSAQLAGDGQTAQNLYQSMTKDPDTAVLGYRGLIMAAWRRGDHQEVEKQVKALEAAVPETPWLYLAQFDLAVRRGHWAEALAALEQARGEKILGKETASRHEAALLLAQAKELLKLSQPKQAVALAEKARKLMPEWLPAALVLAEALIKTEHERAALRVIEKAWNHEPHPQLIPLFRWAYHEEKSLGLLKKIKSLTDDTQEHFVSLMAMAEASMKADLWGEARRYLMMAVSKGTATRSTYEMLARLEMRETRGDTPSAAWLAKALGAAPDPKWHCASCGAAHDDWQASCHSCGAFNALTWSTAGHGLALAAPASRPLAMLESLA